MVNKNTRFHKPTTNNMRKTKEVKVATLTIKAGGIQETLFFEEPVRGKKQGRVSGKTYDIDFMILEGSKWHVIVYKAGDDKTPLHAMEVDFKLVQSTNGSVN